MVVAGGEALDARHRGVEGHLAAEGLEPPFQVRHQCMRVDDPGRGGFEHAGEGPHRGFAARGFGGGDEVRGDGDGGGKGVHFFELGILFRVLGDDPFFGVAVRDRVLRAERVQHFFAAEAEARFQRVGAVVEARVDDLGGGGLVGVVVRGPWWRGGGTGPRGGRVGRGVNGCGGEGPVVEEGGGGYGG